MVSWAAFFGQGTLPWGSPRAPIGGATQVVWGAAGSHAPGRLPPEPWLAGLGWLWLRLGLGSAGLGFCLRPVLILGWLGFQLLACFSKDF